MFNPFSSAKKLDRDRFDLEMQKAAASTRYVMHFTPRSGSSWLADLAKNTRRLGRLDESYNPNFMTNIAKAFNASNHDEYLEILLRRRKARDVFGFQITHHQMMKVFRSHGAFAKRFPTSDWYSFWLVREDIVAQAVSLYKMVQTDVTHAPHTDAAEIRKTDTTFEYDGDEIKRWLVHILMAERGTEAFFSEQGITPFRMTYERNHKNNPRRVTNMMLRYMGLKPINKTPESSHVKIATSKNSSFADQFKADFPGFIREVKEERAPMLARVENYLAVVEKAAETEKKRVV